MDDVAGTAPLPCAKSIISDQSAEVGWRFRAREKTRRLELLNCFTKRTLASTRLGLSKKKLIPCTNHHSAIGNDPRLCHNPDELMQPDPSKHIVLYDGECPLCTFQMKVLTWLDWFHAVQLVPVADARAASIAPELTREDLLEAIHCVARDGQIHRGARCIRFVGMRMPLLLPVSLILWLPGVIWVAEKIYMWISRNRHLLSRIFGCKGACAILPARKR